MTATAKQPTAGTTDVPTFRHFVDGEWVDSSGGGTFSGKLQRAQIDNQA